MDLLERVELGEQGIQAAEKLERRRRVEVDNGREREAEEEIVGCFTTELADIEVGHAIKIGLVEVVGLEPEDAALVPIIVTS